MEPLLSLLSFQFLRKSCNFSLRNKRNRSGAFVPKPRPFDDELRHVAGIKPFRVSSACCAALSLQRPAKVLSQAPLGTPLERKALKPTTMMIYWHVHTVLCRVAYPLACDPSFAASNSPQRKVNDQI